MEVSLSKKIKEVDLSAFSVSSGPSLAKYPFPSTGLIDKRKRASGIDFSAFKIHTSASLKKYDM